LCGEIESDSFRFDEHEDKDAKGAKAKATKVREYKDDEPSGLITPNAKGMRHRNDTDEPGNTGEHRIKRNGK